MIGAVYGGWLGRREAAHAGMGLGGEGMIAGTLAGAMLGLAVHALSQASPVMGVCAIVAIGAATDYIMVRW